MQIINIKIKDLKVYEKNARTHPKKQIDLLVKNIEQFGFTTPILVNEKNEIIAGHGRKMALEQMGKDEAPCVRIEGLSEQEVKALRLADNQIANMSDWDMELVIEELKELEPAMLDLTGFEKDLVIEADEKDDEVPEAPEEPKSKIGDLYEIGNHRILCGDSTKVDDVEILMNGNKADMVFTDPPYGVSYDGGHATEKRRTKLENDDVIDMYAGSIPLLYSYSKDSAPLYIWFADRYAKDVLNALEQSSYVVRTWIIWNKNLAQFGAIGAQYKTKHEPVIYAFKKGKAPTWLGKTNEVTVWDIDRHNKNEFHPTQKPVALSERAICNHIGTDGIVLDLFLGSGSTMIGAEKTGRTCYGMELDPKYVDVIIQRYVDYVDNPIVKKNGIDETNLWNKTRKNP